MQPRVRTLYKTLTHLVENHPTIDPVTARGKLKQHFLKNAEIDIGSDDYKKCLAYGRYMEKELESLIHLHKYRTMKKRYSPPED